MNEGLVYEILSVVVEIPEGRVCSYGEIARLIGREKNARLVGKVLSNAALYGDYPCHRAPLAGAANAAGSGGRSLPGQRHRGHGPLSVAGRITERRSITMNEHILTLARENAPCYLYWCVCSDLSV